MSVSKFNGVKRIHALLSVIVGLLVSSLLLAGLMPIAAQDATPAATEAAGEYLISVAKSKDYGDILVGNNGMTLYAFTVDPLNQSMCDGGCAKAWPPLTVKSADELTHDEDIPGTFATITRKDGSLQVTYNGVPLYYWFKDKVAGDTTGNRVTRNWWVVPPATVYAQELPKVGNVLVGPTGMTLYMFTKDTADTSTCTDKCATTWPPLTVKSADDLVSGVNLPGKWNTIKRADGTLQVTYNGWPLYYFAKDKAIGDTMGDKVGNVWNVVAPETVAVSDKTIVVSADGMTLYTFAKDTANTSTCTGDCAKAWPPFWVYNSDKLVAGTGITGKLGTIKLDDATMQVTYNGMPLYVYSKDKVPGDTTGDKVGNVWSVVKP